MTEQEATLVRYAVLATLAHISEGDTSAIDTMLHRMACGKHEAVINAANDQIFDIVRHVDGELFFTGNVSHSTVSEILNRLRSRT